MVGSTNAAFSAGIQQARKPIAPRPAASAANVNGSVRFFPRWMALYSARMRTCLPLLLVAAFLQQAPRYSVIQDGEAHGDAPYLLEEGWEPLLNGTDLTGWRACDGSGTTEWYTTRFVRYERILGPTQLSGRPAPSGVMLNGPGGRTRNLCTDRRLGDVELYLEFMIAKGSNSGVYLHGLYEMQVFDSWGSLDEMSSSDAGAIYHRWMDNRGVGGSAPRVNAAKRPGGVAVVPGVVSGPAVRRGGPQDAAGAIPQGPVERPGRADRRRYRGPDPRLARDSRSQPESADAPGRPRPGGLPQPLREAPATAHRPLMAVSRKRPPGSRESAATRRSDRTLRSPPTGTAAGRG